ncbi:DUF5682 family protein [Actinomadura scrupuli]|uniref:DUF5682 family protein n=1 Tax=Actinomadura scrupuli TaxID=559629 RepID=UPI003D994331
MTAQVRTFGIRHHGPGSARTLGRALEEFKPDLVLIEGPPEADAIVGLAAEPGMVPPVALLAYVPGPAGAAPEPAGSDAGPAGGSGRRAAFWPFAEFSPEWNAVRYAMAADVPVRFCDLPAAHQLADPTPAPLAEPPEGGSPESGSPGDGPSGDGPPGAALPGDGLPGDRPEAGSEPGSPDPEDLPAPAELVRMDPLGWLAEAAGYDDAERWWDDVVEHRGAGPSPFQAIAEAMRTLREHAPPMPADYTRREERREAYMRRTLRRALKEGFERVAVVCGAWHVPAIEAALSTSRSSATSAGKDDRLLRGLPKVKVDLTWVPWTHGRLASWSGYGAGVRSPGWYHHLFSAPDRPIERWLTQAARVLREEDLPVSSAHVIEAVRLADALAALRGRPLAGLEEVTEATRAVLCEGAELPLELIQRRMVVGERLGAVPDSTPMVPLQRDLQAQQRRLKFRPDARGTDLDLDLRKPTDLERSRLLHRLGLLGVGWGTPQQDPGRGKGTFRESWSLLWKPEFDVDLIEAGAWGTTVREAAGAKAVALAGRLAAGAGTGTVPDEGALPRLTGLAERCLLADLGQALPLVMRALADRAAADTDVVHLMAALPALVRALRYGDVRGTDTRSLGAVVDGLVVRVCVGLSPAAGGLDDDAARALLKHIDEVNGALALLDTGDPEAGTGGTAATGRTGHVARWQDALTSMIDRPGLHGLIEGRLTRLLRDAGRLDDVPDRMARAVSVGATPARAAAWIEGFLAGGGLVLVHDDALLRLVDEWISGLPERSFTDVLPLLRRTFSGYAAPERRSIGERVRRLDTAPHAVSGAPDDDLDGERAGPAARTVAGILGWTTPLRDS